MKTLCSVLLSLILLASPALAENINGDLHGQRPDGANWSPLNLDANGNLKVAIQSAAVGFFALFNDITWGDGTQAAITWTWNLTSGDPSLIFGSGLITSNQSFYVSASYAELGAFGTTNRISFGPTLVNLWTLTRNASSGDAELKQTASSTETLQWTFQAGGKAISAGTSDIGWSVKAAANTACNTTCTAGCVFGQNADASNVIVDCAAATADVCVCAGAS